MARLTTFTAVRHLTWWICMLALSAPNRFGRPRAALAGSLLAPLRRFDLSRVSRERLPGPLLDERQLILPIKPILEDRQGLAEATGSRGDDAV